MIGIEELVRQMLGVGWGGGLMPESLTITANLTVAESRVQTATVQHRNLHFALSYEDQVLSLEFKQYTMFPVLT